MIKVASKQTSAASNAWDQEGISSEIKMQGWREEGPAHPLLLSYTVTAVGAHAPIAASQLAVPGANSSVCWRCRRRRRRLLPAAPAASPVAPGELHGVQAKVQAGDEAENHAIHSHRPGAHVADVDDAPAKVGARRSKPPCSENGV